jgi:hypothetical protein
MKSVDWFSKIILPDFLSFVSTIVVTDAALPLSRTSINLHRGRVNFPPGKLMYFRIQD